MGGGVLLSVWGFSSHFGIFHSYRDVTIAGEGANFDLYLALMAIEQYGICLNGHLWGPLAFTPVFDTDSNPNLPNVRRTLYQLSHRSGSVIT